MLAKRNSAVGELAARVTAKAVRAAEHAACANAEAGGNSSAPMTTQLHHPPPHSETGQLGSLAFMTEPTDESTVRYVSKWRKFSDRLNGRLRKDDDWESLKPLDPRLFVNGVKWKVGNNVAVRPYRKEKNWPANVKVKVQDEKAKILHTKHDYVR